MTDTTHEPRDGDEVSLDDFGLFDPAVQQRPHPYYAVMQQTTPVYEATSPLGSMYLITSYDDVLDVVKNIKTFSSRFDTSGSNFQPELVERMKELFLLPPGPSAYAAPAPGRSGCGLGFELALLLPLLASLRRSRRRAASRRRA